MQQKNFIRKLFNKLLRFVYPEKYYQKTSYAQCGEDLLIQYIFKLKKNNTPCYIDIGTNHPYHANNTMLFYKLGAKGMCIEPNLTLQKKIKKQRKKDIVVNYGVGANEGYMDFFIFEDDTLSTFSVAEKNHLESFGKKCIASIPIKVKRLKQILDEFNWENEIDFISLDVEGLDYDILKTMFEDSIFPKLVCVESYEFSIYGNGRKRKDIEALMQDNNYMELCTTPVNSIYVLKDFWQNN